MQSSGSWESSPANKPSSPSLRLPTLPPSAQHVLRLLHARCRSLPPLRIPPTCPSATSSPAPRRSARLGAWHLLLGLPTPTRCRPGKMAPTTVASTPAPPHPYRFIWADALLPQEGVRRTPPPALPRVRSARRPPPAALATTTHPRVRLAPFPAGGGLVPLGNTGFISAGGRYQRLPRLNAAQFSTLHQVGTPAPGPSDMAQALPPTPRPLADGVGVHPLAPGPSNGALAPTLGGPISQMRPLSGPTIPRC